MVEKVIIGFALVFNGVYLLRCEHMWNGEPVANYGTSDRSQWHSR